VIPFAERRAIHQSVARLLAKAETKLRGQVSVLLVMARRGISFSSSAAVYREADTRPTPDEAPLDPQKPYAATEAA
jgi:UDP-glucose 4-epimerase